MYTINVCVHAHVLTYTCIILHVLAKFQHKKLIISFLLHLITF